MFFLFPTVQQKEINTKEIGTDYMDPGVGRGED